MCLSVCAYMNEQGAYWFLFKLEIIHLSQFSLSFLALWAEQKSQTLQGVSTCIIQELQVHNDK